MAERRIKRPADKKDVFDKFVDSDIELFDSYKDLMVFAACVGFHYQSKETVEKSLEPIPFPVFSPEDRNIMKIIALAETKDVNILSENDETHSLRADIFEEYANSGLGILRSTFHDIGFHTSVLDKFADFTLEPLPQ